MRTETTSARPPYRVSYTDMGGNPHVTTFPSRDAMEKRLAYLDAAEQRTRECAPTDSGRVRMDYLMAATAIRVTLAKLNGERCLMTTDRQRWMDAARFLGLDVQLVRYAGEDMCAPVEWDAVLEAPNGVEDVLGHFSCGPVDPPQGYLYFTADGLLADMAEDLPF